MTWLVRLGTERGAGAYVLSVIVSGLHHDCVIGTSRCASQRFARRFTSYRDAMEAASVCGGRVVRLRRKKR